MAIERTVRGRIVPGVDGPVSAPSASFQDFTDYDASLSPGHAVRWVGGALAKATSTSPAVTGLVHSIADGVCRVQITGVFDIISLSGFAGSYMFVSSETPGTKVEVGSSSLDTAVGPLVGFWLSATELQLMCSGLAVPLLMPLLKMSPTAQANDPNHAILAANNLFLTEHDAGLTGPVITLATADDNMGSNDDLLGRIEFAAADDYTLPDYDNIHAWEVGAQLEAVSTAQWNSGNTEHSTALAFFTRTSGDVAPVERMRLDHDGQLGLGTQDPEEQIHATDTIRSDAGLLVYLGDSTKERLSDGVFVERSGVWWCGFTAANGNGRAGLEVRSVPTLTLENDDEGTGKFTFDSQTIEGHVREGVYVDLGDADSHHLVVTNGKSAVFDVDEVIPSSTDDKDLGSSARRWGKVWADEMDVRTTFQAETVTVEDDLIVQGAVFRQTSTVLTMTANRSLSQYADACTVICKGANAADRIVHLTTAVDDSIDGRVYYIYNVSGERILLALASGGPGDEFYNGMASRHIENNKRAVAQAHWDGSEYLWLVHSDTLEP